MQTYGRAGVRDVLTSIPATEIKPRTLRLAGLIFGMSVSIMHREVLTRPAGELFASLSRFSSFYLAGGTAFALQIGHRVSVDFDFFSGVAIDRNLLQLVRWVFPAATIMALVNNKDELSVLINGVKVTFLRYPFPALEPFVAYEGLRLLSVRDIAATKAYTIGRRGSYKDYVGLYFIMAENHATLADIIENAEYKFGMEFNSRLFLEQLVFLGDIEDMEIKFLKPSVSPKQLLTFFQQRIREHSARLF
jgi:hypothetical protein